MGGVTVGEEARRRSLDFLRLIFCFKFLEID